MDPIAFDPTVVVVDPTVGADPTVVPQISVVESAGEETKTTAPAVVETINIQGTAIQVTSLPVPVNQLLCSPRYYLLKNNQLIK
jgi:hypothetical protein